MDAIKHLLGYQITERLYVGARTLVYRGVRTRDACPVIIKVLRNPFPSFNDLVRFRNQYTIARQLDLPNVVQVLDLEPYKNGYALIMEDFGGISLKILLAQVGALGDRSQDLHTFFQIALQLADALEGLYCHRVIHKDIKPANILIHPTTQHIKLIDFSIASLLPHETQTVQTTHALEGTLAYLSPEQTGRMNRGIDYRSDFYALGVTFYELLTGQLPFQSEDPLELIHCHLAKSPVPLEQLKPHLPRMLSELVQKLMAKNAEDRYQGSLGLKHDLERCLAQWNQTQQILSFPLGQRDVCDRFLIPEKLYGRQAEVESLLNAFERVRVGRPELMLVAGLSGIGKTAVVNEIHKPIVKQRGYFIKGKYEPFHRNIPFSAFVQAFRDLMGQILSESDHQLLTWKTKILEAVGDNGQVLIEVIPELERVIGKQPSAPELSGTASENRFNLLMQKFIRVFTTSQYPLVLFLDDLQWADLASLKLVQLLMQDTGHLLMIGTYRDNEVSAAHPLMLTLDAIQRMGVTVNTLWLESLTLPDLNQLVADTLNCDRAFAQPLTELVMQKTKGSPFFTIQFLKALYDDHHITFMPLEPNPNPGENPGGWQCDIARIRSLALTDDVVEFMALQLQKLPQDTQDVLKVAACIGTQFDLQTLAVVCEEASDRVATALWLALQEGLILPITDVYKFFTPLGGETPPSSTANPTYRFLHDRVQQAAYSLIPEFQKPSTHLQIGKILLRNTPEAERDEHIFKIVNQLNMGRSLVVSVDERKQLIHLNQLAARKARTSTAYDATTQYLEIGIELLPPQPWQNHYKLTQSLYEAATEAAYLSTNYERMEQLAAIVLSHAHTFIDKVRVYEIKMLAAKAEFQHLEAIRIGLQLLDLLGITFPANPTASDVQQALEYTEQMCQDLVISSLLDAPTMTDPSKLAAMRILTQMIPSAYQTTPFLLLLLIVKQIHISLEYGNCMVSPFTYADYGLILCGVVGDLDTGYQFGQLALNLIERFHLKAAKCRTDFIVHSFISHWKEPLSQELSFFQNAYQVGLETGDLESSALNAQMYCSSAYFAGVDLNTLAEEVASYHQGILQLKQETTLSFQSIYYQAILNLLGHADDPCQIEGEVYSEVEDLPKLYQSNNRTALYYLYYHKMVICYLLGRYQEATENIKQVESYADCMVGMFAIPVSCAYSSLVRLARIESTPDTMIPELEEVEVNQSKLKHWADHTPMNHLHRFYLVEAERQRVFDNKAAAIAHYDLAIQLAQENKYLQDEALACELAAKFYLSWDKPAIAQSYMTQAYYAYSRWGAKIKIDDLERRYPQLLAPILQKQFPLISSTETILPLVTSQSETTVPVGNSLSEGLDLRTILRVFQTLSSEIELEKLLSTLVHVLSENAGADKCVFLMPKNDDQWVIEALSQLGQPEIILKALPLEESGAVPLCLINTVCHTLATNVIWDAMAHPVLSVDPYVLQHTPRSILCTPILHQGKLVGILYLENKLTTGVFSGDRLEVLNLLCTQAATSLNNARIYQLSQTYAKQLEHSLAALHASQSRFQKLADSVPGAIYQICLSIDGEVSMPYISSGCYNLYEVTAEELISGVRSVREFEHPDDRPGIDQAMFESAQTLTPFSWEWRIVTPSGQVKWVQAVSQPERQSNGSLLWDGIILDISDRKQAEQALQLTQFSVEHAADQVLWVLPDARFLYANQSACLTLGYTLDELRKMTVFDIDVDFAPEVWAEHWQKIQRHDVTLVESRHRAKDGRIYPVEITTNYREFDGQGYNFAHVRDISDRKRAEAELQQAQMQMVQSEKMSALGNLVAGVAHEINNPIGFISGNIQPALDYISDLFGLIDHYQQEYKPTTVIQNEIEAIDLNYIRQDLPKLIQSMNEGVKRIRNISTSLRTFSRADSDRPVACNLHDGINSTLLILKHRLKANEKRPEIEVITQYGELPQVECFAGQLNQVFMNLIANAIDALEDANQGRSFTEIQAKPNQITIKTGVSEDQNYAVIRIQDNGIGMSHDVQDKIFDHLYTTKGVGQGTGLGLAIARQIVVEKHSGRLEVNSEPLQGAEFIITVPLKAPTF